MASKIVKAIRDENYDLFSTLMRNYKGVFTKDQEQTITLLAVRYGQDFLDVLLDLPQDRRFKSWNDNFNPIELAYKNGNQYPNYGLISYLLSRPITYPLKINSLLIASVKDGEDEVIDIAMRNPSLLIYMFTNQIFDQYIDAQNDPEIVDRLIRLRDKYYQAVGYPNYDTIKYLLSRPINYPVNVNSLLIASAKNGQDEIIDIVMRNPDLLIEMFKSQIMFIVPLNKERDPKIVERLISLREKHRQVINRMDELNNSVEFSRFERNSSPILDVLKSDSPLAVKSVITLIHHPEIPVEEMEYIEGDEEEDE